MTTNSETQNPGYSKGNKNLQHLGSIYTPNVIAKALADWAINSDKDVILDLGVGNGSFVWAAFNKLSSIGDSNRTYEDQIYGTEIYTPAYEEFILNAKELGVNFNNVVNEDFFSINLPFADCIVGNPPYVRRRSIENASPIHNSLKILYKNQNIYKVDDKKISRSSDMYLYFLLKSLIYLKDGGRIAVIISDSWMSAEYGTIFKEILLKNFKINRIVGFDFKIFDADIHSVVVFATRCPDDNSDIPFIKIKHEGLLGYINSNDFIISDNVVINEINKSDISSEVSWSIYFNDFRIAREIENNNYMIKMCNVAETRGGFQTLAKEFYLLSNNYIDTIDINRNFLRPILYSVKELEDLVINDEYIPTEYIFYCDKLKGDIDDDSVLNYIRINEEKAVNRRGKTEVIIGYHNKPRIIESGRNPWYNVKTDIERRGCAFILIPRLIHNDWFIVWNQAQHVPGESFVECLLNNDYIQDIEPFIAFLLSSIAELNIRMCSHVYGGGISTVSLRKIRSTFVLDMHQLTQSQRDALVNAYQMYIANQADRHKWRAKIDQILYSILNISLQQQERIEQLLAAMRADRGTVIDQGIHKDEL